MKHSFKKTALLVIAVVIAILSWRQFDPGMPVETTPGANRIVELYLHQQSDTMVEFEASVNQILADDTKGSPHQRFILRLGNGHTVLIAHNIELADRVPIKQGDLVNVRGEYEFNPQGGVVHWTHRDPGMGVKHGWVEHQGIRYD